MTRSEATMLEFLAGSGMFMPHGHCYLWTPTLLWLMVGSDLLIALSYFAIPIMMGWFLRERTDIPFRGVFVLFSAFIVLCGLTHAWDIVTTWVPSYWIEGVLKLATGLVSCATAVVLWPTIPKALALRSPAELADANARLEQAVADLEAANAELRESERLKTRLVENLSHELRTPLTLVQSPAEALLSGAHGPVPAAWTDLLRTIATNSARLDELVQNALELARLDAGQLEAVRQPVDVGRLVREVVRDFAGPAATSGLTLAVEDELDGGSRSLDRYLYERVVLNLITNALKFTPEGGAVTVRTWAEGDQLHLEVADTGQGIDPDEIDRIFGRFSQGDASRTRRHDGAGLGLALVREVVALVGGEVGVTSAPGQGSTFRVTLPAPATDAPPIPVDSGRRQRPTPSAEPAPAPAPTAAPLPRLLLAEDNPDMAHLVAAVLRDVADVTTVCDGAAALEAVRADRPALVLADVMMPEMDGLALCRHLKSNPETRAIPVVLLSARGGREALMEGWSAGADEYLFKPFHPRELQARVRSLLDGAQARSAAAAARARAEQAEAHNAELAAVAASLSHDVAAPLRIIHQSLGLLSRDGEPDTNAEIVHAVRQRVARLQLHTATLLGWLRAGRIGSDPTGTPLDVAVDDARGLLEIPQGFTWTVEGGAVTFPLHRADLSQVLVNLVRNAVQHHTGDRGVVWVGAAAEGRSVTLEVRDDGPGIPDDRKRRVLGLFESGGGGGTGVGLALVDRVVRRTGGTLRITDAAPRGCVVTLRWPSLPHDNVSGS